MTAFALAALAISITGFCVVVYLLVKEGRRDWKALHPEGRDRSGVVG